MGVVNLVVLDDDPDFTGVLIPLLSAEGYRVWPFSDPASALEQVAALAPDLVLMDLGFGRGDSGWALAQALRRDARTRRLPLIVWSASPERLQAHAEALTALTIPTLTKPFDFEDLRRHIRNLPGSAANPPPTAS